MTTKEKLEAFSKIDFGDPDGLYDDVAKFFLGFDFEERVLDKSNFFVIGRKGTGKSALFRWVEKNAEHLGLIVENISLSSFPMEKFKSSSDDNFVKPYQFQSIWKNIVLSLFSKLFCENEEHQKEAEIVELRKYLNAVFGSDLTNIHGKVAEHALKIGGNVRLPIKAAEIEIGAEFERTQTVNEESASLVQINNRIEKLLKQYLRKHPTIEYIVQIDQIDDSYNSQFDIEKYLGVIASLCKFAYHFNKDFRELNLKLIIYLRSDIFSSIHRYANDSSHWRGNTVFLDWSIRLRDDWKNPMLLRMINKRIFASFSMMDNNLLSFFFPTETFPACGNQELFTYMIHRSFHRPRDIIRFCKYLADECRNKDQYSSAMLSRAETHYSQTFIEELENEINPVSSKVKELWAYLREMRDEKRSFADFSVGLQTESITSEPLAFCKLLYSFGIIVNIDMKGNQTSIIRNENSQFSKSMNIQVHPGLRRGLFTMQH